MHSLCTLRIYVVYLIYFALQPPKRSIEESTVEEMPKKRQCSDREEDKDKQTYGITGFFFLCASVCGLLLFCFLTITKIGYASLDSGNFTKGEDFTRPTVILKVFFITSLPSISLTLGLWSGFYYTITATNRNLVMQLRTSIFTRCTASSTFSKKVLLKLY